MIASNVTEADLDILRAQTDGAEAEVIAIFFGQDDTTAVATVHVANIMLTDTIGRPGHMVEEAEYSIPAVFRSATVGWSKWHAHCEVESEVTA